MGKNGGREMRNYDDENVEGYIVEMRESHRVRK